MLDNRWLDANAGKELGEELFDVGDGGVAAIDELLDAPRTDKSLDGGLSIREAK